jgi:hypothetical protein
VAVTVIFRGDAAAAGELVEAIAHNCSCKDRRPCAAHLMMSDQGLLDRLLFARWLVDRLHDEEFSQR